MKRNMKHLLMKFNFIKYKTKYLLKLLYNFPKVWFKLKRQKNVVYFNNVLIGIFIKKEKPLFVSIEIINSIDRYKKFKFRRRFLLDNTQGDIFDYLCTVYENHTFQLFPLITRIPARRPPTWKINYPVTPISEIELIILLWILKIKTLVLMYDFYDPIKMEMANLLDNLPLNKYLVIVQGNRKNMSHHMFRPGRIDEIPRSGKV